MVVISFSPELNYGYKYICIIVASISIIIYTGDKLLGKNRAFNGYYVVKNKSKYAGDPINVFFRSSWEKLFCKWCDTNKNVKKWAIEPLKIPYIDSGTGKPRMYNPDFYVEMVDGKKYLIEVKPKYETVPPVIKKESLKLSLAEATYKTNTSKWEAAKELCKRRKWDFKIVTEDTLASLGIKIIQKLPAYKRKRPSRTKSSYKTKKVSKKISKRKKACQ